MEQILTEGLAALGIEASSAQIQAMAEYGRLLLEANEITNLTAITEPEAVARLHFLDSAALLGAADFAGKDVLDVGSGAGFPGVPLRILRPDMGLTCLDSVGKKMDFVRQACGRIGLEDVICLWGRAEEMPALRERFDVVTSRAVAELTALAELCLPQVKVGGLFLAMKKPDCDEEVARGDFAVRALRPVAGDLAVYGAGYRYGPRGGGDRKGEAHAGPVSPPVGADQEKAPGGAGMTYTDKKGGRNGVPSAFFAVGQLSRPPYSARVNRRRAFSRRR